MSLNRTSYIRTSGPARLVTIQTEVNIDLMNSRFGSVIGVTEHSGSSTGGHYVAYTKIGGQWFKNNDTNTIRQEPPNARHINFIVLSK